MSGIDVVIVIAAVAIVMVGLSYQLRKRKQRRKLREGGNPQGRCGCSGCKPGDGCPGKDKD